MHFRMPTMRLLPVLSILAKRDAPSPRPSPVGRERVILCAAAGVPKGPGKLAGGKAAKPSQPPDRDPQNRCRPGGAEEACRGPWVESLGDEGRPLRHLPRPAGAPLSGIRGPAAVPAGAGLPPANLRRPSGPRRRPALPKKWPISRPSPVGRERVAEGRVRVGVIAIFRDSSACASASIDTGGGLELSRAVSWAAEDTPDAAALVSALVQSQRTSGSRTRARMSIEVDGNRDRSLQVLIKTRRDGSTNETLVVAMWPRDDKGRAWMIRRTDAGEIGGFRFTPPNEVVPVTPASLDDPLFGSDLSVEDFAESFWDWPHPRVTGSEKVGNDGVLGGGIALAGFGGPASACAPLGGEG